MEVLLLKPRIHNIYSHTDANGLGGASSIESIPIEKAVIGVVKDF